MKEKQHTAGAWKAIGYHPKTLAARQSMRIHRMKVRGICRNICELEVNQFFDKVNVW